MPGIAGIINLSQTMEMGDKKRDIRRMSNILSHTSPCSEEVTVFDNGAMAAVHLKLYPFHGLLAEDATNILAFWGYLWDEQGLRHESGQDFKSLSDIQVGQLLLEIYRKKGVDSLCKLNGRFVIAIWDKYQKKLHLICDRYGFTKLFYWVGP